MKTNKKQKISLNLPLPLRQCIKLRLYANLTEGYKNCLHGKHLGFIFSYEGGRIFQLFGVPCLRNIFVIYP